MESPPGSPVIGLGAAPASESAWIVLVEAVDGTSNGCADSSLTDRAEGSGVSALLEGSAGDGAIGKIPAGPPGVLRAGLGIDLLAASWGMAGVLPLVFASCFPLTAGLARAPLLLLLTLR